MQLLTPKEVAVRLSVSPRTVYSWIAKGRLDAVHLSERVTRVPAESVDALVRAGLRPATTPGCAILAAEETATYGATATISQAEAQPDDSLSESQRLWATIQAHREQIISVVERNKGFNVRVFGSVVHGDATEESDIDLLIDARPGMTLFCLAEISMRLEEMLGRPIDVVVARSLRSEIREGTLSESWPL